MPLRSASLRRLGLASRTLRARADRAAVILARRLHPMRLRRTLRRWTPRPELLRSMAARLRTRPLRRRIRRWAIGGAFGLVAASCALGLTLLILARSSPSWWRTVRRDDPATIALGTRVENAVWNRIFKNRAADQGVAPGGPWRSDPWIIDVKAEEANAWLNVRLPRWLTNQKDDFHWPKDVSDIQVDFRLDRVTIGARVRSGSHDQVLSATLEPRLDRSGRLFLPARWVNLGRLSIPADWVLDRSTADQYIPRDLKKLPETDAILKAFTGADAVRNTTVINLGDGRSVRILAIAPGEGVLRITCQTEMQ